MPDPAATPRPSDLIRLGGAIREALAQSDALGLPYVAIHLCNALEALETAMPHDDLPIDPDTDGAGGSLPG